MHTTSSRVLFGSPEGRRGRRGWGISAGLRLAFAWPLLLLTVLGCGGGNDGQAPAPAATPTPAAAVPTTPEPDTVASPVPSALFTLTLPDGTSAELSVFKCEGTAAGQMLDVRAVNTQDMADADRIEVQVGGVQQGPGRYDTMYVAVFIGAQSAWAFQGNTPTAQVTLEADGAGHFGDIGIVNIAVGSPSYQYNVEYKFSGEWSCR